MVTAPAPYDNASLGVPRQKLLQISSAMITASTMVRHNIYNTEAKRIALKFQDANG